MNQRVSGNPAPASTDDGPLRKARKNLAHGDAKNALVGARSLFKKDRRPEYRAFLSECLIARARQLQKSGALDEATQLVAELESLGKMTPAISQELQTLRLLLGLNSGGSAGPQALDPQVLVSLADQAVIRPDRLPDTHASIKAEGARIRLAFEALERGEDEAVGEILSAISSRSPFADWRMLIRGLIAHYAKDLGRRDANWQRLDGNRPAAKIAAAIVAAAEPDRTATEDRDLERRVRRLRVDEADGLCQGLDRLVADATAQRWKSFGDGFRSLRKQFGTISPDTFYQVGEVAWRLAMSSMPKAKFCIFLERLIPLPLDPRGKRVRALAEEFYGDRRLTTCEELWLSYLKDLAAESRLSESDRELAASLVRLRLADHFKGAFEELSEDRFDVSANGLEGELERAFRERAESYYRTVVVNTPHLLEGHQKLIDFYLDTDRLELAAQARASLVQQFPDDYDSLCWLVSHYAEKGEPELGRAYLDRAVALRPRDKRTQEIIWRSRSALAISAARRKKFDEARRSLADLVGVQAEVPAFWLDVQRAAVEFKAKDSAAAQRYLEQALTHVPTPVPVWLTMLIESTRYGLAREVKSDFANRFKDAMKARCASEVAGQVAKIFLPRVQEGNYYSGMKTHLSLFAGYVTRGVCRWNESDLMLVCEILHAEWSRNRSRSSTLAKMTKIGVRSFRSNPWFPYWALAQEMAKGPWKCNLTLAEDLGENALSANARSRHRLSNEAIASINSYLDLIDDYHRRCRYNFEPEFEWSEDFTESQDDDPGDQDSPLTAGQLNQIARAMLGKQAPAFAKKLAVLASRRGMTLDELLGRLAANRLSPAEAHEVLACIPGNGD